MGKSYTFCGRLVLVQVLKEWNPVIALQRKKLKNTDDLCGETK